MIEQIAVIISGFIIAVITKTGYLGIILLMGVESANIPLPSEIIMPFSGFLVSTGKFNLWLVAIAGAVGNLAGSLLSYWLGAVGGRPLVERYGKYVLISHHDLAIADRWFARYGEAIVFFSRILPVIRTFISFPAGIARMNLARFSLYSFAGSLPWSLFLAWVGLKMGQNWEILRIYFREFDILITIIIVLAIVWWIWRHIKNSRASLDR